MLQRGRKRKAIYDKANEDEELLKLDGDNALDDAADTPEDDLEPDLDDLDNLDAIMGETFADDQNLPIDMAQEEVMPSRAQQSRPEDSVMDANQGNAAI